MKQKLALVQHPMYLLIEEDTQCAERTPPWGAPDIDTYIDRLRRNLETLEATAGLRVGYEWSALELARLAERAPEVSAQMGRLAKEGKCTFYNGTYAQPHHQVLSSEASYRQFQYGMEIYDALGGTRPLTYAHQESSVHDQLPQLLEAFGIEYVAMPEFICTLLPLDPVELMYHGRFGPMFVIGEEIVRWRGLDGTEIPLYLHQKGRQAAGSWLDFQQILGLQQAPPIAIEIPDLIEIDEAWLEERSGADFVILEEAIAERLEAAPPRGAARLYSNWSYMEGIRAEELSRANWAAERAALRAEALGALAQVLVDHEVESTHPIWEKILLTQHHDVYCFCGPELRDKSIRWLGEAETQAEHIADRATAAVASRVSLGDGQGLVVFNTTPHPVKTIVELGLEEEGLVVRSAGGDHVPSEVETRAENSRVLRFVADVGGLGYESFLLAGGEAKPAQAEPAPASLEFENQFYRAVIQSDGTLSSLILKQGQLELLTDGAGELMATDSTGLGSGPKEDPARLGHGVARPAWKPPGSGPELAWQGRDQATVTQSPLGVVFRAYGSLGDQVRADLTVRFYQDLPRIDFEWEFAFSEASMGTFYDDDSKLRVHLPVGFSGAVWHDIAFGCVETRRGVPFFPATWVDVSDGTKGIARFHQGTYKHWMHGDVLVNLLAWGEYTDGIGNRLGQTVWGKSFDQRLRGIHTIRYALYPHAGDWRSGGVVAAARAYNEPLVARRTAGGGAGASLPSHLCLLSFSGEDVATTCVQPGDEGGLSSRLYSLSDREASVRWESDALTTGAFTSLAGQPINTVRPFQIATVKFEKDSQGEADRYP